MVSLCTSDGQVTSGPYTSTWIKGPGVRRPVKVWIWYGYRSSDIYPFPYSTKDKTVTRCVGTDLTSGFKNLVNTNTRVSRCLYVRTYKNGKFKKETINGQKPPWLVFFSGLIYYITINVSLYWYIIYVYHKSLEFPTKRKRSLRIFLGSTHCMIKKKTG